MSNFMVADGGDGTKWSTQWNKTRFGNPHRIVFRFEVFQGQGVVKYTVDVSGCSSTISLFK
ncbi:hypothetical protein D3C80_1401180 [compost metagenome]